MKTKQTIELKPELFSNFPSKFIYVVQGLNGADWVDSKFGGQTISKALKEAEQIDCMTENTKLRIVKGKN